MIMTNQGIINIVVEKLKETGKLSLRGDDLYRLFITNKELEYSYPQIDTLSHSQISALSNQFIDTDFAHFKNELLNFLTRNKIYCIVGDNGFLDIFASKEVFDDYKHVYMTQEDIYRLDTIIMSLDTPRNERVKALKNVHELYNKKARIIDKYGE